MNKQEKEMELIQRNYKMIIEKRVITKRIMEIIILENNKM